MITQTQRQKLSDQMRLYNMIITVKYSGSSPSGSVYIIYGVTHHQFLK